MTDMQELTARIHYWAMERGHGLVYATGVDTHTGQDFVSASVGKTIGKGSTAGEALEDLVSKLDMGPEAA